MMSRIPARLNRIAEAFNEAAKTPKWLCQSSGSEYSPEDSTDLSDLVNSFLERDCKIHQEEEEEEQDDSDGYWSESDTKHRLQSLLSNAHDDNQEDVKQKILKETELACRLIIGDRLSEGFKRQLMSHLRDKGFDAGQFVG